MKIVSSTIILITMIFMLIGALDYIQDNKRGYGEEFVKGINTCGPFILGAAVMIAIAPYLSQLMIPYLKPLASFFHCDPSIFPAMLLCSDMGGYAIGINIAGNETIGLYNGLVVASIIGATFTFIIPMALSILSNKEMDVLASGILTGMISLPTGCFVAGLSVNLCGYSLSIVTILTNLIPVILLSVMICILLLLFPKQTIKVFGKLGKLISIIITVLTALAIFQLVTKIHIPYLDYVVIQDESGYSPFEQAFVVCGSVAIVLAGAFPMVKWLMQVLAKPFNKLEKILEVDHSTIEGLLAASTNHIAGLNCFKEMDQKGQYYTMSFMIGGGCMIGDLLGFVAGINSNLLIPMMIGKLVSGILALVLAKNLYLYLFKE